MKLHITPRETQVMELLTLGNSQKEIAEILQCSVNTVDVHVKNIKSKTGQQKSTEIVLANLYKRYNLPLCDLPDNIRRLIAAALLAISLTGIVFSTTDFIRVLRPPCRTVARASGGRRSKDSSIYFLNVA